MTMTTNESTTDSASDPTTQRPSAFAIFKTLLWDVGLALAAYYGARALGFSPYVSLLTGTVVSGLRVGYVAVRARRLDGFAAFLLTIFGVGLALSFVTGDDRFLLLKDSFGTALAGLIFLGTCLFGRPLIFYAAKRTTMVNDPGREARWETRWREEPAFRRTFVLLSVGWGVGLLVEALVRVPLIYLLPIDVVPALSTALQIAAFVVLIFWTLWYVRRVQARSGPR